MIEAYGRLEVSRSLEASNSLEAPGSLESPESLDAYKSDYELAYTKAFGTKDARDLAERAMAVRAHTGGRGSGRSF